MAPLLPLAKPLAIVGIAFTCAHLASGKMQITAPLPATRGAEAEVLYLPNGRFLNAMSFGYRNALGNIIWLSTLNYFGKHHRTDQNFMWLGHMCALVSELNPRALTPLTFCANMLAWEAHEPEQAVAILSKAITHHPNNWELYYLRGFTSFYFLKQSESAKKDFMYAATLPGVHPLVVRLAAQKLISSDNAATAIEFLENILSTTTDPISKEALESRLREAAFHRDIQTLSEAMRVFVIQKGENAARLQELVEAGIIAHLPVEPFGGSYIIDSSTGQIQGTSPLGKRLMSKDKP
jgi:tetratricopeptide (TPR) repeat protein